MLAKFARDSLALISEALGIGLPIRRFKNLAKVELARKTIRLGPIPQSLKGLLPGWLEESRRAGLFDVFPDVGGLFIYGDTVVCCYLKESSEILSWDAWDDVVTTVEDGPGKVSVIVIASQRRPELACWLPVRTTDGTDCVRCKGGGWMLPPWPRVICPDCSGLGWMAPQGV